MFSFPNYPPAPQFGQLVPLFLDVKNDVLAHITEPSNNDYNNDGSDNCDFNFGTFDIFGVKNDQKVSHNMILIYIHTYRQTDIQLLLHINHYHPMDLCRCI